MNRPQWLTAPGFRQAFVAKAALARGYAMDPQHWPAKSKIMKLALTKQALAGGLAVLLAVELLLPGPDAAVDDVPPAVPASAPAHNNEDSVAAWSATALARPLFSASRRPVAEAGAQPGFTLPRLSAIIVSGTTRRAIFAAAGQKPVMAGEGGTLGPYRITAITPYSVRLLGPDGNVTLHLQALPPAQIAAAGGNS